MKEKHIDMLVKTVLNRWKLVTCETPHSFAINRKFISLAGFQSIKNHSNFDYAVEHIKNYHCYEIWERIMKSIKNINISADEILNELNAAIRYKLMKESFTSDIYIHPSHIILDQVVKILIDKSDKSRGCDEYIHIEAQEKWVQTDVGGILAEGGTIQDLEAFKQIICGIITSKIYQKRIRRLCLQLDNEIIKNDMRTFKDQLSHIASIAEHTHKLRGKCKACPRILWIFSP